MLDKQPLKIPGDLLNDFARCCQCGCINCVREARYIIRIGEAESQLNPNKPILDLRGQTIDQIVELISKEQPDA